MTTYILQGHKVEFIQQMLDGALYFQYLNPQIKAVINPDLSVEDVTNLYQTKLFPIHPLEIPGIVTAKYLQNGEIILKLHDKWDNFFRFKLKDGRWHRI